MASLIKRGANAQSTAVKRIKKEIADLAKEDMGGITLTPNESNIFSWKSTLPGPTGSPYEGGLFEVDIRLPDDYPFSPPHLHFMTKVYHCNIAPSGAICLDLLKNNWSPALSLYKVILSLSSLLTDPNPSDPLVPSIASEYKRDRKKHDATAKDWVDKPKKPPAPTTIDPSLLKTTSSSRARPIARPAVATTAPPAQIAGTRRSNPYASNGASSSRAIDITGDSDNEVDSSDAEIALGGTSRTGRNGTTSRSRESRAPKRARVADGEREGRLGTADDVIVVDE